MLSSAVEGFSQSRWQEAAGFGIKVTLIEPTGYSTDWSRSSAKHATPLPVYDQIRDAAAKARAQRFTAPGNPGATRDAILTLVDSDNPPLRLFLGESPLRIAVEDYGSQLAAWAQWQQVAAAAQGTQGLATPGEAPLARAWNHHPVRDNAFDPPKGP